MDNFTAKVLAELDTSKIPEQIKGMQTNQKIVLNNIDVNTKAITSKIQSALNAQKFTINVQAANVSGLKNNLSKQVKTVSVKSSGTSTQDSGLRETEAIVSKLTADSDTLYTKMSRLGQAGTSVSGLTKQFKDLNNLISQIKNGQLGKQSQEYKDAANIIRTLNNQLKSLTITQKTFVNSLQVSKFTNQIDTWMDKNSKAVLVYGDVLTKIKTDVTEAFNAGNLTDAGFKKYVDQFNQVKQSAIAAGKVGDTFTTRFSKAFNSISRYVEVSTLIFKGVEALKAMYQNVLDIDSAMTELKKVTNETAATYQQFLSDAGQTATQIGSTVSDVVNSTASFARLGYSFNEAQDLSKVATIYSVVGDEVGDIDNASKSIISTMAAFNVEAKNSMSIVDKYNEVGNRFAISSGGIGDAMQRSASSLAAARNDIDESIALITGANTVVQDPDVVGTALKTKFFTIVFMYRNVHSEHI